MKAQDIAAMRAAGLVMDQGRAIA